MESDKFQMLTSILENMKYEDMKHSDLENAIVKVMDRFDNYLDRDQKSRVLNEFARYEKKKKETVKKKGISEDEEQKELLKRFISSEQFEF